MTLSTILGGIRRRYGANCVRSERGGCPYQNLNFRPEESNKIWETKGDTDRPENNYSERELEEICARGLVAVVLSAVELPQIEPRDQY